MGVRRIISEHKLASILVVGVVARLILMPFTAHPFDVYAWYQITTSIIQKGPLSVQFMPPLWGHYMLIPVAYVYSWLAGIFPSWARAFPMSSLPAVLNPDPTINIQLVPGLLFNFVVKFPFLISDVLITLLLYKSVENFTKNKGLAEKAAVFWFLNPFVIWISAVWGMWDTLAALFSLATLYFLLKNKFALSAISLSLGVASKLYPALFLLPVAVYFSKSSPENERWKKGRRFFGVFSLASVLLFLPYFSLAAGTLRNFLAPSPSAATQASLYPFGFGLSYWSVSSLNVLFHFPPNPELISAASIASVFLTEVILIFVYWKTSKMTFQKPILDLGAAMLLALFALFLSYPIICEQWFIWALPFLIILCIGGRIKIRYYLGASALALIFSFTNCLLPFFFLPLAPWIGNILSVMANTLISVWSLRVVFLAALGCLFSVLLLLLARNLLSYEKKSQVGLVKQAIWVYKARPKVVLLHDRKKLEEST